MNKTTAELIEWARAEAYVYRTLLPISDSPKHDETIAGLLEALANRLEELV
jgi:hypothetical protein